MGSWGPEEQHHGRVPGSSLHLTYFKLAAEEAGKLGVSTGIDKKALREHGLFSQKTRRRATKQDRKL